MDLDALVFKALADSTRRALLDRLFERDGQTLSELEARIPMTRFGVMKHLRLLESAGLVLTRRVGREKEHFLNRVPIQQIYDRWISKYAAAPVELLAGLKRSLEAVPAQSRKRKRARVRTSMRSISARALRRSGKPSLLRNGL
jgi:DNA-binding transcriptional ArsR family regulator